MLSWAFLDFLLVGAILTSASQAARTQAARFGLGGAAGPCAGGRHGMWTYQVPPQRGGMSLSELGREGAAPEAGYERGNPASRPAKSDGGLQTPRLACPLLSSDSLGPSKDGA